MIKFYKLVFKQVVFFGITGLSNMHKYSLDMTSFLSSLLINKIIKIKVFEYEEDWGEIDAVTDLNFYTKQYNPK